MAMLCRVSYPVCGQVLLNLFGVDFYKIHVSISFEEFTQFY